MSVHASVVSALPLTKVPFRLPRSLHAHDFAHNRELGVFSTDLFTVGPQVTGLAAADLESRPNQWDDFTLGFASNDNELHFHGNRPDLYGLQR